MGARSGGGAGASGRGASTPKSVLDVEKKIRNNDWESIFAFSRSGKLLAQNDGTSDQVYLDDKKVPKGSIVTHNHPADGDLSKGDIFSAAQMGLSEIRAVGPHHTYVAKPSGSDWNLPSKGVFDKEYSKEYQRQWEAFEKKGLSTLEEWQPYASKAMKKTLKKYGVEYKVIKNS